MAFLLGGANSAADTAFSVANSCRFNDGDSAQMQKDTTSGTSIETATISLWCKRTTPGGAQILLAGNYKASSSYYCYLSFRADDKLMFTNYDNGTNCEFQTNRLFRDPSAWYHICVRCDLSQAEANRVKIYVNGTQETSFSTSTNMTGDQFFLGKSGYQVGVGAVQDGSYLDGYLAEVVYIDGTSYAPTSFGEFDEDSPQIWKPKDVSGLTFGTNGFYLDFEDSANLGNDANGGTDLTETNIAAADQAVDSPTNNFATMNPLDNYWAGATISEGNCKISSPNYGYSTSTFALTRGKWYAEFKIVSFEGAMCGIASRKAAAANDEFGNNGGIEVGYAYYHQGGVYGNAGTLVSAGGYDSFSDDDIIGCALDLTNNRLYFAVNGTWQGSSDPTDGTNALTIVDPVGNTDTETYFFAVGGQTNYTAVWEVNFGGCSGFTVSSSANDANGYGNFEYAPPSGYYSLCTKNLVEYG